MLLGVVGESFFASRPKAKLGTEAGSIGCTLTRSSFRSSRRSSIPPNPARPLIKGRTSTIVVSMTLLIG